MELERFRSGPQSYSDFNIASDESRRVQSSADARSRIVAVVMALNVGEVVSYGDIAEVAGMPGRARLVGRILAESQTDMPWWRVVTANGRLAPGLEAEQSLLLGGEGVVVRAGRVAMAPLGRFRRQDAVSSDRALRTDT